MSETLQVAVRDQFGKLNNRRLRAAGQCPAVLYGHGKEPMSLSLSVEQLRATLRHGAKVVDLTGAHSGQALFQDVQWDVFHQEVLHVDLLRVEAGDKVEVEVPLQLRGEAPGEHDGGKVELLIHAVQIEVAPHAVPEVLHINVNHLELGQALTLDDIEDLPAGAKVLTHQGETAVTCSVPVETPEEEAGVGEAAEPEVIGRSAESEDEE